MEEKFKDILRGSIVDLPKQRSRIISVFLSSTFTGEITLSVSLGYDFVSFKRSSIQDMKNERDTIIKNLYPELKKYCQNNYNLDFQVSSSPSAGMSQ